MTSTNDSSLTDITNLVVRPAPMTAPPNYRKRYGSLDASSPFAPTDLDFDLELLLDIPKNFSASETPETPIYHNMQIPQKLGRGMSWNENTRAYKPPVAPFSAPNRLTLPSPNQLTLPSHEPAINGIDSVQHTPAYTHLPLHTPGSSDSFYANGIDDDNVIDEHDHDDSNENIPRQVPACRKRLMMPDMREVTAAVSRTQLFLNKYF